MARHKRILAAIILTLITPALAFCLPSGASGDDITSGLAVVTTVPDTKVDVVITNPSANAIINWGTFDTDSGQAVNFYGGSTVLNRIANGSPTNFLGTLYSETAKIFVVNPNGVIFGAGSRVDAPALVASTLEISDADFRLGAYNFLKKVGVDGSIINEGNINVNNGGYVCLLSQAVENRGVIIADLGTVVLAAGEKMTLNLDPAGTISVVIDDVVKNDVLGMKCAIKNSGVIRADGGKVILNAEILNGIFDYAINNTGVIQAINLVNHNGVIELVAEGDPIIDDVTNTGMLVSGFNSSEIDSLGVFSWEYLSGSRGFKLIELGYYYYDNGVLTRVPFAQALPGKDIKSGSGTGQTSLDATEFKLYCIFQNGKNDYIWYEESSLNSGSKQDHVKETGVIYGFEDYPNGGDQDFDDAVIRFASSFATYPDLPPEPDPTPRVSASDLWGKEGLPYNEQFAVWQYNAVDPRLVYFYHPITASAMNGFDEFVLEEGAYDFIEGSLNIKGHQGLLPILEGIK
ncbi:MAG: filamentous hemagglutinin N-terminal domain-containing protein [Candidatus Omnitrophota bacterium]